ncbi:fluconazole resistance protein 1 [Aaosphaeria arxii CBS 175.79]|uniref:Fluconazole resistance protein 1 n=1 Tax=Aaosphaeria arxii CBS 175.79 TaxID=1450172 RepID=A0A6A5X723_9PLEO|nr:fluconazole resistance protein 1 [Aaosphaeria arxii CBS 175.79]KAF2008701.1 fluconazole resistance protein 1 [Aaosphaeria arxii CBS 175.79]
MSMAATNASIATSQDISIKDQLSNNATGEKRENIEADGIVILPKAEEASWQQQPSNPLRWSSTRKWTNIILIAVTNFFAQMAYTAFQPALPTIMNDLHVMSNRGSLSTLTISINILGYVFGPIFIAPVSEHVGRRTVLIISIPVLIISIVGPGASTNIAMFLVFRALGGFPTTSLNLISYAIVADLLPVEKRGLGMSIVLAGPSIGPTLGPLTGGYITQYIGWRWIFWIYTIAAGFCGSLVILIYRETYNPILERRYYTSRLNKHNNAILDNESERFPFTLPPDVKPPPSLRQACVRPFKLMLTPVVIYATFVCSIANSYLVFSLATLGTSFQKQYGFSASQSGLAYLGMTAGFTISQLTAGLLSDRYIKRKTNNGELAAKPEYRLPILMIGAVMLPAGFVVYGWGLEYQVQWIIPIIGSALISLGVMYNFMPVQMYVVDSFTIYSVSATGAVGIIRSIITTVFPLAGDPLYTSLGYGWGNTLLAFIALSSLPMAIIFCKYGEKWRLKYPPKF